MDKIKIYQKIQTLGSSLLRAGSTHTRADVAFELKDCGINADSLEVSKLIWEAYTYYNKDAAIGRSFRNNEDSQFVVDEYEIYHLINQNASESLFPIVQEKLNGSDFSLKMLQGIMSKSLGGNSKNSGMDLMGTITGTKGISDVQAHAKVLFGGYTSLIDSYYAARGDVKNSIKDFVGLREDIARIYRDYAMKLVDIYGDSIKIVAPELFDFNTIQFLNVAEMFENIRLKYDQLSERCSTLIGEVSANFSSSLDAAAKGYRLAGNNKMGLIIAAIGMTTHYLDAKEKALRCQREFGILKLDFKHDETTIKGDYIRLASIYKILNNLYVPKANAFYKYGDQVLSSELSQLFDTLYQSPKIKEIAQQREEILHELMLLGNLITDRRMNIEYYTESVKKAQSLRDSMIDKYRDAAACKPSRPFFLFNLLTFGTMRRSYNRSIYEWNVRCAPVIKEYENYLLDLKLDQEEMQSQRSALDTETREYSVLKQNLEKLNKTILSEIRVSDSLKLQMADHLESIINLLWIAKNIVESKFDEKYMNVVKVTNFRMTESSTVLQQNIHTFTNYLKTTHSSDKHFADKSSDCPDEIAENQRQVPEELNLDEVRHYKEAQNLAVQKSIDLFEAWVDLQTQRKEGQLIGAAYDRELEILQHNFQQDMQATDTQRAVLMQVVARINTAHTAEQLKEGMLALSGSAKVLTAIDIEQILNGTATIEI